MAKEGMLHEVPAAWLPQAREACSMLLPHLAQKARFAPNPALEASLAVSALRLAAAASPKEGGCVWGGAFTAMFLE